MIMQKNVIWGIQIRVSDYSEEVHQHIKVVMEKFPLINWIHSGRNYGVGDKMSILSFYPERLFYFEYKEKEINTPDSYILVGMILNESEIYSNENAAFSFTIPKLEESMEQYLKDAIYLICEDKPEYIIDTVVSKSNCEYN